MAPSTMKKGNKAMMTKYAICAARSSQASASTAFHTRRTHTRAGNLLSRPIRRVHRSPCISAGLRLLSGARGQLRFGNGRFMGVMLLETAFASGPGICRGGLTPGPQPSHYLYYTRPAALFAPE